MKPMITFEDFMGRANLSPAAGLERSVVEKWNRIVYHNQAAMIWCTWSYETIEEWSMRLKAGRLAVKVPWSVLGVFYEAAASGSLKIFNGERIARSKNEVLSESSSFWVLQKHSPQT